MVFNSHDRAFVEFYRHHQQQVGGIPIASWGVVSIEDCADGSQNITVEQLPPPEVHAPCTSSKHRPNGQR